MPIMLFESAHKELRPDIRGRTGGDAVKEPCSICGKSSFYVLLDNPDIVYCVDHAAELQLIINRLRCKT